MFARGCVAFCLLTLSVPALACSCADEHPGETPRQSVDRKFARFPLVMVADVVSIKMRRKREDGELIRWKDVEFYPRHVFKGLVIPEQTFRVQFDGVGTSCDIDVRKGESWLIYADPDRPMEFGFCSSESGPLVYMLDEIAELVPKVRGTESSGD